MVGLMMQWIESMGGVDALGKINDAKASALYDAIDGSRLFKSVLSPASQMVPGLRFRCRQMLCLQKLPKPNECRLHY